jgi:hypothetical protein
MNAFSFLRKTIFVIVLAVKVYFVDFCEVLNERKKHEKETTFFSFVVVGMYCIVFCCDKCVGFGLFSKQQQVHGNMFSSYLCSQLFFVRLFGFYVLFFDKTKKFWTV